MENGVSMAEGARGGLGRAPHGKKEKRLRSSSVHEELKRKEAKKGKAGEKQKEMVKSARIWTRAGKKRVKKTRGGEGRKKQRSSGASQKKKKPNTPK